MLQRVKYVSEYIFALVKRSLLVWKRKKQFAGDNSTNDFQGFVLDDSPKTVEEQLQIIKNTLSVVCLEERINSLFEF